MSQRNGDKARHDSLKKRRTQRRMKSRELAKTLKAQAQAAAAAPKA
jgi:hypothetical protein